MPDKEKRCLEVVVGVAKFAPSRSESCASLASLVARPCGTTQTDRKKDYRTAQSADEYERP